MTTGRAGPRSHYEALDFIHVRLLPRTYVEIGVNTGTSLALALPGTRVVGIDPKPRLRNPISRSTKVFPLTSDTFFELWDLDEPLGGRQVDLAFIDGMHLFEYALRDFANLERSCTPDSVVILHDCLPATAAVASRRHRRKGWTGDVWKLAACLRRYRPDLQTTLVDVPGSGLGIVRGLDPQSTVLNERRREILREFLPLGLDSPAGREAKLHRLPGDWETLRSLLPARPYRRRSRALLRAGRFGRHALAKKLARRALGRKAAAARLRARIMQPGRPL